MKTEQAEIIIINNKNKSRYPPKIETILTCSENKESIAMSIFNNGNRYTKNNYQKLEGE